MQLAKIEQHLKDKAHKVAPFYTCEMPSICFLPSRKNESRLKAHSKHVRYRHCLVVEWTIHDWSVLAYWAISMSLIVNSSDSHSHLGCFHLH